VRIKLLPAARADLVQGFRFYGRQLEGLGEYFLDSLYSDIESLRINAGVHAIHFGRFHRLLSKRFPFAIYYQVATSEIHVIAVLDARQGPAWLRQQVAGRAQS
jgi:plasmid stabilization system protein ParE